MARSIVKFFSNSHTRKVISKLKSAGINTKATNKKLRSVSNIAKKSFVITGTLNGYNRKEIEDVIKDMGGKVSSTVSNKTDFLVVGELPGSKLERAKELDITILNKEEFENLIRKRN